MKSGRPKGLKIATCACGWRVTGKGKSAKCPCGKRVVFDRRRKRPSHVYKAA